MFKWLNNTYYVSQSNASLKLHEVSPIVLNNSIGVLLCKWIGFVRSCSENSNEYLQRILQLTSKYRTKWIIVDEVICLKLLFGLDEMADI